MLLFLLNSYSKPRVIYKYYNYVVTVQDPAASEAFKPIIDKIFHLRDKLPAAVPVNSSSIFPSLYAPFSSTKQVCCAAIN